MINIKRFYLKRKLGISGENARSIPIVRSLQLDNKREDQYFFNFFKKVEESELADTVEAFNFEKIYLNFFFFKTFFDSKDFYKIKKRNLNKSLKYDNITLIRNRYIKYNPLKYFNQYLNNTREKYYHYDNISLSSFKYFSKLTLHFFFF